MNKLSHTIILVALVSAFSSCVSSGDDPGIEYAPQMYVSQAYEPYSQEKLFEPNPNGMTMRLPVNGTIARGQLNFVYPHPNTGDGYEASASFTSDLPITESNVAEGKRLYDYACWHCHGKKGGNDGPIFESGKMPGPSWPNVQADYIKNIPMGKMYHTITYGKGIMGSHAAILSPDERWKVIYHIKSMSLGEAFEIQADPEDEVLELIEQADAHSADGHTHEGEDYDGHSHEVHSTDGHTHEGEDYDVHTHHDEAETH
ncbi:MAG: cytochrome c [Bacteroidia bacterium]